MIDSFPPSPSKQQGAVRLIGWIVALLVLWLGLLPEMSRLKPVAEHLEQMRAANINAGVMFYSELESGVVPEQPRINDFLKSRGYSPDSQ